MIAPAASNLRSLPTQLQEELTATAQMVAANAPSTASWEAALAAVCDGFEEPSSPSAFRASLGSLQEIYRKAAELLAAACRQEGTQVAQLGGLCVLGTERHEARRIDNQLRGRAGRQGDPGSSRFYLSLGDKVFRVFGGDAVRALTAEMGGADDVPIVSPLISGALDEAQNQVQSFFFGIRKDVFKYDEVLDQQRQVIYGIRRKALLDSDEGVLGSLQNFCEESMAELVEQLVRPE
ncbi:unnamed protein product, partial [Effrenium voratum]